MLFTQTDACDKMDKTTQTEINIMSTRAFLGLNNNQLKIIAMLAMLIDHIGVELLPQCLILRIIGRLSFPIFAYMIAEGCRYTKNRTRYLLMILGLALGCQAVFFIAEGSLYQGILVTFSLSIITVFGIDGFVKERSVGSLWVMILSLLLVLAALFAAPVLLKAYGYRVDYGALGVFLPVAVYFSPNKMTKLMSALIVLAIMGYFMGGVQWFALLAIPLLLLYNGERGRLNLKYLFYIFYPAHLAVIYLIGLMVK